MFEGEKKEREWNEKMLNSNEVRERGGREGKERQGCHRHTRTHR